METSVIIVAIICITILIGMWLSYIYREDNIEIIQVAQKEKIKIGEGYKSVLVLPRELSRWDNVEIQKINDSYYLTYWDDYDDGAPQMS